MATRTFNPIYGKRLRVLEIDDCGNYTAGTSRYVTTDGFITLNLSTEVEDGTEIVTRKADGSFCVNEMGNPSFKRFTVEIEFCGVHPSMLAITTNAVEYEDYAGDVAGFTVAEGEIASRFALELWTGLAGAACEPGVSFRGGYMLLPYLQSGTISDVTVDGENAVNFTLTGAFTKGGNGWGVGPFDVVADEGVAAPLPTALDPYDHFLMIETTVAPPEVDDSPVALPTP